MLTEERLAAWREERIGAGLAALALFAGQRCSIRRTKGVQGRHEEGLRLTRHISRIGIREQG